MVAPWALDDDPGRTERREGFENGAGWTCPPGKSWGWGPSEGKCCDKGTNDKGCVGSVRATAKAAKPPAKPAAAKATRDLKTTPKTTKNPGVQWVCPPGKTWGWGKNEGKCCTKNKDCVGSVRAGSKAATTPPKKPAMATRDLKVTKAGGGGGGWTCPPGRTWGWGANEGKCCKKGNKDCVGSVKKTTKPAAVVTRDLKVVKAPAAKAGGGWTCPAGRTWGWGANEGKCCKKNKDCVGSVKKTTVANRSLPAGGAKVPAKATWACPPGKTWGWGKNTGKCCSKKNQDCVGSVKRVANANRSLAGLGVVDVAFGGGGGAKTPFVEGAWACPADFPFFGTGDFKGKCCTDAGNRGCNGWHVKVGPGGVVPRLGRAGGLSDAQSKAVQANAYADPGYDLPPGSAACPPNFPFFAQGSDKCCTKPGGPGRKGNDCGGRRVTVGADGRIPKLEGVAGGLSDAEAVRVADNAYAGKGDRVLTETVLAAAADQVDAAARQASDASQKAAAEAQLRRDGYVTVGPAGSEYERQVRTDPGDPDYDKILKCSWQNDSWWDPDARVCKCLPGWKWTDAVQRCVAWTGTGLANDRPALDWNDTSRNAEAIACRNNGWRWQENSKKCTSCGPGMKYDYTVDDCVLQCSAGTAPLFSRRDNACMTLETCTGAKGRRGELRLGGSRVVATCDFDGGDSGATSTGRDAGEAALAAQAQAEAARQEAALAPDTPAPGTPAPSGSSWLGSGMDSAALKPVLDAGGGGNSWSVSKGQPCPPGWKMDPSVGMCKVDKIPPQKGSIVATKPPATNCFKIRLDSNTVKCVKTTDECRNTYGGSVYIDTKGEWWCRCGKGTTWDSAQKRCVKLASGEGVGKCLGGITTWSKSLKKCVPCMKIRISDKLTTCVDSSAECKAKYGGTTFIDARGEWWCHCGPGTTWDAAQLKCIKPGEGGAKPAAPNSCPAGQLFFGGKCVPKGDCFRMNGMEKDGACACQPGTSYFPALGRCGAGNELTTPAAATSCPPDYAWSTSLKKCIPKPRACPAGQFSWIPLGLNSKRVCKPGGKAECGTMGGAWLEPTKQCLQRGTPAPAAANQPWAPSGPGSSAAGSSTTKTKCPAGQFSWIPLGLNSKRVCKPGGKAECGTMGGTWLEPTKQCLQRGTPAPAAANQPWTPAPSTVDPDIGPAGERYVPCDQDGALTFFGGKCVTVDDCVWKISGVAVNGVCRCGDPRQWTGTVCDRSRTGDAPPVSSDAVPGPGGGSDSSPGGSAASGAGRKCPGNKSWHQQKKQCVDSEVDNSGAPPGVTCAVPTEVRDGRRSKVFPCARNGGNDFDRAGGITRAAFAGPGDKRRDLSDKCCQWTNRGCSGNAGPSRQGRNTGWMTGDDQCKVNVYNQDGTPVALV